VIGLLVLLDIHAGHRHQWEACLKCVKSQHTTVSPVKAALHAWACSEMLMSSPHLWHVMMLLRRVGL
jgi:hypothetical protein